VRRLVDAAAAALLATVVLGGVLVLQPVGRDLALHVYLLALAAIAMSVAVSVARAAVPVAARSPFAEALRRRPPEPQRPPQLERIERAVTLGVANTYDFHARLRPVLRDVAAARLARSGVDLDTLAGRAAVGDDAWELLRPDRPPPDERFARGIEPQQLRSLVDMLETL